ncbi:MAG: xanthine dehydrogenase family protein [Rhodobacteraceae bacterium]|nr:xanthine dehydrogenase family protein [Paracoccaceae bacterium]MCF8514450.1 xanthine dehydrogenase family protein [Paracoccaceae bacterium]MCF8518694.1 xanthine dehydrogenase family protein [Paracoccaceae bacterium]
MFLRSDYPAGNFELRDLQAARALPGVLAILTADDLTADGIGLLAPARLPNTADGQPVHVPPYPPLAAKAVHHVGAPLVAVVAETLFQAQAAAEAIEVVIEAAPFSVTLDQAAVLVWNSAPKDRVFTHAIGDAMAVSAAVATAALSECATLRRQNTPWCWRQRDALVARCVGSRREAILYDPATGQLLTGSFMDYPMPRATDLPNLAILSRPTRTVANPLGGKGAGEAGTVGALGSTMSAVADALAPLGIHHVDMPASPCALWTAIQAASGR